ncbi:MAG: BACON domain-containing protein [Candidatus Cryptobacteroides sp.]
MKKSILVLCACALVFAACKEEVPVVPAEITLAQKTEYQIPVAGTEDLLIPFTSSKSWTASLKTPVDWVIISPSSGDAGECEIHVIATAAKDYESREAVIVIKSEDQTAEVTLVQGQVDNCTLLTTDGAEFDNEGGEATITVKTNIDWFVIVPEEDQNWIHLVQTKAYAEESVKVKVDPYLEIRGERSSVLYVVCGDESARYTVKQTGPVFELVNTSAVLDENGGPVKIDINTNAKMDWTFTIPEDAQSWIHLGEKAEKSVTVNVDSFMELDGERDAVLKVTVNEEDLEFKVSQKGPSSLLWFVHPTEALEGFDPSIKSSLANIGENLIVSNGSKVYVLNALTGEVVNKIDLGDMYVERLISDDAGHLLASVDDCDTENPGEFVICKVDINTLAVEPFITYNTGNLWVKTAGNIRVSGDITKQAEIVATASLGFFLVWHVVDGELSTWYYGNTPYYAWNLTNSCTAPAGSSIEDGYYYIAYGAAGDYDLYYLNNFVEDSEENAWARVFETGCSNENFNCIDVAEFNGTQYVGFIACSWWSWSSSHMWILDATDKTAMKPVMDIPFENFITRDDSWANIHWTDGGAYSDIILVPTESALVVGYIENNVNVLGVSRWL